MLHLQQTYDLHPASAATRDRFVEVAATSVLPAGARAGGRLGASWLCHEAWRDARQDAFFEPLRRMGRRERKLRQPMDTRRATAARRRGGRR
jgi:hypothetical protein